MEIVISVKNGVTLFVTVPRSMATTMTATRKKTDRFSANYVAIQQRGDDIPREEALIALQVEA